MTPGRTVAEYKANLGRHSVAGKKVSVQRGYWVSGRAPFGYKLVSVFDEETREHRSVLVVVEKEAKVVRQIFRWFVDGIGTTRIVGRLKASNTPPPGTAAWTSIEVRRILQRPTYAGMAFFSKGRKPIRGGHKAIVSKALFQKAQELRAALAQPQMRRGGGTDRALAFVTRCLVCGAGFKLAKVSKGCNYLGCRDRYCPGPTCSNTRLVKEDDLVEQVRGMLLSWFVPKNLARHFADLQKGTLQLRQKLEACAARARAIDAEQHNLLKELATGEFPRERIRRVYDELEMEKNKLESDCLSLQAELSGIPGKLPADVGEYCAKHRKEIQAANGVKFRTLLQLLGVTVLVGQESVEISHAALTSEDIVLNPPQAFPQAMRGRN